LADKFSRRFHTISDARAFTVPEVYGIGVAIRAPLARINRFLDSDTAEQAVFAKLTNLFRG
jgi:hypothetical protein